jgi:hypothetical protein
MITLHWFIIADTAVINGTFCAFIFLGREIHTTMKKLPQFKRDSSFDHEFPNYFGQFQCTGVERRYDAEERVSSGSPAY